MNREHNTSPVEREPTHRNTDPETFNTDTSSDMSYIMNADRPCVDDNENPSMKRNVGDKIRFTNDYDQFKDEKLFVREGVNYDLDKFRIFLKLDGPSLYDDNDVDVLNRIILGPACWGTLFGCHTKMQPWSKISYLRPEEVETPMGDNLTFSPIVNQMQCICREPFEVWIEQKHAIQFVSTMTRYGWPMSLNDNRHVSKNMIEWDSCGRNPPSISMVFRAIAEVQAQHIMIRKQGMRWKITDYLDPVQKFFMGLERMRSYVDKYNGEVSLTHIDIAQEWAIPIERETRKEGFEMDVKIPRWTHQSDLSTRKDEEFYTSSRIPRTNVEYYPQFTGLTGVKDGGITINNRACHRSPKCNGLAKMTCYLGTFYHALRERSRKIPNLNSHQCRELDDWTIRKAQTHCQDLLKDLTKVVSLLLNETVPFQMRTEMKFRFSYNKKDQNNELRTTFGLQHFIAVCNDIDTIRETWQVRLSRHPVYLSGICKAVQINVGQMYREVSRRINGSLKASLPGNIFLYFRYLNSNVLCNLGFTGSRVDQ